MQLSSSKFLNRFPQISHAHIILLAARRSAPTAGLAEDPRLLDVIPGIAMATRPAKRRKKNPVVETISNISLPVVFVSPVLKPDVRFTICSKYEFHLHSVVVKLKSAYLRRFLDSADKSGGAASTGFQYEYVSVKDEQGWVVEPKKEVCSSTAISLFSSSAIELLGRIKVKEELCICSQAQVIEDANKGGSRKE